MKQQNDLQDLQMHILRYRNVQISTKIMQKHAQEFTKFTQSGYTN